MAEDIIFPMAAFWSFLLEGSTGYTAHIGERGAQISEACIPLSLRKIKIA